MSDLKSHAQLNPLHELLQKHEMLIKRFIRRRSGPLVLRRTTIEDLYQETMISALRSEDRFVQLDRGQFLNWIYLIASRTIARSLAMPAKRMPPPLRLGRYSSDAGVLASALPGPSRTPSSVAASAEQLLSLRQRIESLPPRFRDVLTQYKIEEQSLSTVAQNFGLTKNGAARLIERAIGALRKRYKL